MIEALWSVLSHPGSIAGRDGGGTLIVLAGVVALVTAAFMTTLDRVMRRHPILAGLIGGGFLPLVICIGAYVVALNQPSGTDGGGMLVFAAIVLAICALPVTMATSALYVRLRRKRIFG